MPLKMKCALCKVELTESNDSAEHLIPNGIGGWRKVRGFICRSCNNMAGNRWDAELARQLNFLSLKLGIQRDRGEVPSQRVETVDGEQWQLHHGGSLGLIRPTVEQERTSTGDLNIAVRARSGQEVRRIVEGLARKHPGIDVERAMQGVQTQEVYPEVLKVRLDIGGNDAGRSIVKSALCMAFVAGVDIEDCTDSLLYLRDDDARDTFCYFYERDLVRRRPHGLPIHCVAVSSAGCDGQLLGYVEFYGAYRMVVRLAREYRGPLVRESYAIDPVISEVLQVDIDLALTREDVDSILRYERASPAGFKAAIEPVLSRMLEQQRAAEWSRRLDEATAYAFANCGATAESGITAAHVDQLVKLTLERLAPYLAHQSRPLAPDPDSGD